MEERIELDTLLPGATPDPNQTPADESVRKATTEIESVEHGFATFIIKDDETAARAAEGLVILKRIEKWAEDRRVELVAPDTKRIEAINARFRAVKKRVGEAKTMIGDMILKYRAEKAERARIAAEAERVRAAEAEANLEKELGISVPTGAIAPAPAAEPAPQPTKIQTDTGSLQEKKVWVWEVTDPQMIPREYLTTLDTKITEAVRSGVRAIDGIRIWQKSVLASGR